MRPAEFEEKDFEGLLYNSLFVARLTSLLLGRSSKVGFVLTQRLRLETVLFGICRLSSLSEGVVLNHYRWGFIWRREGIHSIHDYRRN